MTDQEKKILAWLQTFQASLEQLGRMEEALNIRLTIDLLLLQTKRLELVTHSMDLMQKTIEVLSGTVHHLSMRDHPTKDEDPPKN